MTLTLNHTIVWCRDKERSAHYLTKMLGLPPPRTWGQFRTVTLENGVSLDFHEVESPGAPVAPQHYAFLVSEPTFDEILHRIRLLGVEHWADPGLRRPGAVNTNDGGRGVYFKDPDGHLLEAFTRPYGSGG